MGTRWEWDIYDTYGTIRKTMAKKPTKNKLTVETLKHEDATRKNIPTAEHQSEFIDDLRM